MKNKKGFSLVELIAAIFILAIVAMVAVVSYNSIKGKTNDKQYISLATTIEAAAQKYASDTGVTKMFVQTLIDKGLVQTDDESKQIYDPRSDTSMNCRVIELDENGNAKLTENDTTCDIEILKDQMLTIKYCPKGINCEMQVIDSEKWFHEPIDLYVTPSDISSDLDLNGASYSWISPLAPDEVGKEAIFSVDTNYVEDEYQITVTKDGKDYITTQRIRMDQTSPRVYDFALTDPGSWSSKKKITFKLVDYESGLLEYAISPNNDIMPSKEAWQKEGITEDGSNNAVISLDYDFADIVTDEEVVNLYVWVRDVAGNTNEDDLKNGNDSSSGIKIENLDISIDKIETELSPSADVYSLDKVIKGVAKDEKSGLKAYAFVKSVDKPKIDDISWINYNIEGKSMNDEQVATSEKYTQDNAKYWFCVKDNVDNVKCKEQVVTKIDREIDEVGISSNQTSNYAPELTVTGTAKDEKSGIVGYCFTNTDTKPSNFNGDYCQTWNEGVSEYTTSINVRDNKTWYFWVIDALGNVDGTTGKDGKASPVTINKIDNNVDVATLKANPNNWATSVTLTGTALDKKSGVSAYVITTKSDARQISNSEWTNLSSPVINKNVSPAPTMNFTTEAYSGYVYYLYVKDAFGNIRKSSGVTVKVDITGPTFSSGGSVSKGSISTANWYDNKSGVSQVYYHVNTTGITPNRNSDWTTSRSFSTTCEKYYYVYSIAIDKVGNYSNVQYLGSVYSGKCCDEGTWSYNSCTSNGYKQYYRYNGCIKNYQYETRTWESCKSYTGSCSTGSCSSYGWTTEYCGYYYGGSLKSENSTVACDSSTSKTDCKTIDYCSTRGYKQKQCAYYYGGRKYYKAVDTMYSACKPKEVKSTCNTGIRLYYHDLDWYWCMKGQDPYVLKAGETSCPANFNPEKYGYGQNYCCYKGWDYNKDWHMDNGAMYSFGCVKGVARPSCPDSDYILSDNNGTCTLK